MKRSPEIEFRQGIHLLIYRPRGLINKAAVKKIIGVKLNFRYVIHVSLHRRRSHKGRAPVKSAILATDSTLVHYARLLALLTRASSIKVRVFQDRKEAAKWLGVPIELLAEEP